jgi:hypothetical protein
MKTKTIILLILLSFASAEASNCQSLPAAAKEGNSATMNLQTPFIGAQVFIEPGQTKEEIDKWFRVLRDNSFTVCRIRMFESYMKKADG